MEEGGLALLVMPQDSQAPKGRLILPQQQVIRELLEISKGKTLIAVTHDERLTKYFDVVVDMNEMTGGRRDLSAQSSEGGDGNV